MLWGSNKNIGVWSYANTYSGHRRFHSASRQRLFLEPQLWGRPSVDGEDEIKLSDILFYGHRQGFPIASDAAGQALRRHDIFDPSQKHHIL